MPNKPAAQVRKCLHSVFGHQTAPALGRTPPAWSPDLTLAQVVAQDWAPVCPGGAGGKRPGPGRGPGPGARLPRCTGGQGDLAQVGAEDRAPVCPGVPGGKATWPRSGPRTGRRSAPVDRGARRPGPGRGPGPGARLPRWTGGQGDLAQVGAQDRAPVCPGVPGGKATWPRSGPRTGRRSAPVDRGARRPGPGRGPGPGARLPRWSGRGGGPAFPAAHVVPEHTVWGTM